MFTLEEARAELADLQRRQYAFYHAENIVYLDAVTVAPSGTSEGRGLALSTLSGIEHDMFACPKTDAMLAFLAEPEQSEKLTPSERRQVELLRRDYDRESKIPRDELEAYSLLVNEAEDVWHRAKPANDFAAFAPYIEKLIETQRRFASYTDPGKDPYDVALDQHERGLTAQKCDGFFAALRAEIVPLLAEVARRPRPNDSFLKGRFPIEKQRELSDYLMSVMGIDRAHCGIGETLHPFTLNCNRNDVRITTNYSEELLTSSMYSVIHEGGHALYELNVGEEYEFTRIAGGSSMGLHESQSRLYENIIGRSLPFCEAIMPKLRELFPEQLGGVSAEEFYRAINIAEPSLVRTEADELTYCLHIMVRYEIEKGLFNGSIAVAELPKVWNEKMKEYLGVDVPSDTLGVLQDSHWSGGAFGYFPSYALGNAYGAQIFARLRSELDADAVIASGDLRPIVRWLTEKLYRFANFHDPAELFRNCAGAEFDPSYYVSYLKGKFGGR